MTLAELDQMSNGEYSDWCAFYFYEAAMKDYHQRVAEMRSRRR
jgi:hypothetical protein